MKEIDVNTTENVIFETDSDSFDSSSFEPKIEKGD